MGVHDFYAAFDQLDSSQKGYVTVQQIKDFYSTIFDCYTDEQTVQISVDKVCGEGNDKVFRASFLDVLDELERRQSIDVEAYWDFQALDSNGSNHISLTHAFLLFQEYHAELFSLTTWRQFLKSREKPGADVYFDEIRNWLCDVPTDCPPSSRKQIKAEEARLEQLQIDTAFGELEDRRALLLNDDLDREEQDERMEHILHHSKRKLNKWKTHGLGAMLHDDGLGQADKDGRVRSQNGDSVRTSDVIDALDTKYSLLQEKVLMQMASFAANIDSEKSEIFQELKRSVAKLIKDKTINDKVDSLPGAEVTLPMTLLGMMGDLGDAEAGRKDEFAALRSQLEASEMDDAEIDDVLELKYKEITSGEQNCGKALLQLHLRHKAERERILSSIHDNKGSLPPSAKLGLYYWRLLRQLRLLQEEPVVTQAALAVGLAERVQMYKHKRFDWDRQRSETLAELRLEARKGHKPVKRSMAAPDIDSLHGQGSVSLKIRLVEEMEHRHFLEREAMIYFLQGHDSKTSLEAAAKLSSEERKARLRTLRNQREEWKGVVNSFQGVNHKLLQEAIGLYCEERRLEIEAKHHNMKEEFVLAAVLADVQQKQDVEFNTLVSDIHDKITSELTKAVLLEIEATKDEHFNTIAFVVLGCVELRPEHVEYMKALEGKYKAIRDQILVFGLSEQMGSAWKSLSKEDKQREIIKQRKEEKRIRSVGNLKQLDALIGPRSQALASLNSLVGEDKTFLSVSPRKSSTGKPVNLLADLVPRHDQEQDSLLSWLQSDEVKSTLSAVCHVQVARMAAEKFVASSEADHETALLVVGTLERIGTAISGRSGGDRDRQLALAQKRATIRKKCLKHGEKMRAPRDEKSAPKESDVKALQSVVLRTILRRHYKERDVMLSFLQDEGLDELVEAAAVMSPDQATRRVKELKAKREALDLDDKENEEEHTFILEEAGAIRVAGKKHALCRSLGRAVLMDEVVAHLLAELQDLQDVELAMIINQLGSMTAEEMLDKISQEEKAKKNSHCHLVMKVFCKFDGDTSTEDIDKLIEEKYAKLRNHLLIECLSQQQGKQAWAKMGQKQKNKLLTALANKETAMWKEGNSESMSACISPGFTIEPSLPYLTGMGRHQYFGAVFAAESGKISEDNTLKASDSGGPETISFLHRRFMAEGDFAKNYVAGSLDFVPSDDDKQLLVNKLKWEITLLQTVQDFPAASLIAGLAERQNADRAHSLQHDRHRYELLAKQILSDKREQIKKSGMSVIKSEDTNTLQEAVMSLLHKQHQDEWNVLCHMMSSSRFKDVQQLTAVETQQQKSDRLATLYSIRNGMDLTATSEQLTILEEAVTVKKELRRCDMMTQQKSDGVSDEEVAMSLMADLLQAQLCEAQIYMEAFVAEGSEDLQENQEIIITKISQSHVTNIAEIIFEEHEDGESEGEDRLKEAVDGKYDALRDQLLIQALINEMGEAEWRRLSEKERQRLLMELKRKERQLRREGRYDEAAALIGEMLNNDEKIRKLLGDAREDQERKLRERLERRRQRLAEGMTEEECDELEQEEISKEEEEERQRKQNILLYLDHCHDREKDELLKRLSEIGDEHERQRHRQLEMLKLRREQRRLREEGKFDAAAMLMGIAEDNDKKAKLSKEEEKKRQQELARQRLEMARLRRMQGDNLVRGESIVLPEEDEDDETKLSEAVLRVLDKRHQRERELFMKLIDEGSEGDARDEVRVMTDDELKTRLEEIQDLRNIWADSETRLKEDGEKILSDAAVLCIEAKKRDMQADGELASDEDVKVTLLADLQMLQDGEAAQMLVLLTDTDGDRQKQVLHSEKQKLDDGSCDNVAKVLLAFANEEDIFDDQKKDDDEERSEGDREKEEKVVKALEKKYDAMRDKLLMEALMKEMGEAEWARLSELERQKKLMELKREERRLRKEGKMDEAAALLGKFMEDKKEIDRLMGQTAEDQKRRVAEKLALRKKLKEEREAEGLSVDDDTLDELVEEEEKKNVRKNILENLDSQFEEEKAALLASLRGHDDMMEKERQRQLALAKLQREQRRLKQEEKFDSAAMIFAQGQESNERRQQNLLNERDRQRLLAKERLEAMKRQRAAGKEVTAPQMRGVGEEEEEEGTSTEITDEMVFLQDSILAGLEMHQADERDTLLAWISKHDRDKSKTKALANMSDHDLRLKLTKLQRDYENWEKRAAKGVANMNVPKLSPKKKLKLQKEAVQRNKEQADLLEQALLHKFELEKHLLLAQHPDMSTEAVSDELNISAVADLQEKQLAYLRSLQELIKGKNVEELKEMRKLQRRTNQQGWWKTLSGMLLTVSDMLGELHSKEDIEGRLAREFEEQKRELLEKDGSSRKSGQREAIDVDAMLKDLENQFDNRRKALNSDLERQREMLMQRLAAKRQAAEDKEMDAAVMAGQIFKAGEANIAAVKQAKEGERGRQDDLLQQRLQARREARKQAQAKANSVTFVSEDSTLTSSSTSGHMSRQGTFDSQATPTFGLSREKTVVDVQVSDDQKQAMYNQLVKQELMRQQKISAQQSRQEDLLKQKLENRSNKRENEVAALFSLGERQKTILEKSQKDERERQIAQMKERVTRMRESRSRSPANKSAEKDSKK